MVLSTAYIDSAHFQLHETACDYMHNSHRQLSISLELLATCHLVSKTVILFDIFVACWKELAHGSTYLFKFGASQTSEGIGF